MKNLKKMLAVSMILMQLALALFASTGTAAPVAPSEPEGSITICHDMPPIDTF